MQENNSVRLPQLAWYSAPDMELTFPDSWKVGECRMRGHARPALTPAEIRESIRNPLGSLPIRQIARNRHEAVIIIDDMSRSTRTAQIVPFILEELGEAGVQDSHIRFIGATGSHSAMDRLDFVKKLGEEVVRRFPVYSHNPFGQCRKVGVTSFGMEITVNAEVMRCDLKIAIGSIVPHGAAGFGGGSKIILPGICAFENVRAFHRFETEWRLSRQGKPVDLDQPDQNRTRLNMDEAAAMIGLDIKVDAVINAHGETVALYTGTPQAAFPRAVEDARGHYLTALSKNNDIVIANTFSKASEFEVGVSMAFPSLKAEGGDIVMVCNVPEGHIPHYLFGPWGSIPHETQSQINIRPHVNQVYLFTQYPDLAALGYFKQKDKVSIQSNWPALIDILQKRHPAGARVAVYPNSDIQYFVAD